MLSVNTNYSAMVALQNLNSTVSDLETVQNKISTGLKVCKRQRQWRRLRHRAGPARPGQRPLLGHGRDRPRQQRGRCGAHRRQQGLRPAGAAESQGRRRTIRRPVGGTARGVQWRLSADPQHHQHDRQHRDLQRRQLGRQHDAHAPRAAVGPRHRHGRRQRRHGPRRCETGHVHDAIALGSDDQRVGRLRGREYDDRRRLCRADPRLEQVRGPGDGHDYGAAVHRRRECRDGRPDHGILRRCNWPALYQATAAIVTGAFSVDINSAADLSGTARISTFVNGNAAATSVAATDQADTRPSSTAIIIGFDLRVGGTGPLNALLALDIGGATTTGATQAVAALDAAMTTLNSNLATLGSQSKALEIQNSFLSSLSDTVEKGISGLVDADLAKESAKLQSLADQATAGRAGPVDREPVAAGHPRRCSSNRLVESLLALDASKDVSGAGGGRRGVRISATRPKPSVNDH